MGTSEKGQMTRDDYIKILKEVVYLEYKEGQILVEDNDYRHGKHTKPNIKVWRTYERLGIQKMRNSRDSSDLNVIEKVWRVIK